MLKKVIQNMQIYKMQQNVKKQSFRENQSFRGSLVWLVYWMNFAKPMDFSLLLMLVSVCIFFLIYGGENVYILGQ